jgi:hypothetical protein
MLVCVLCQVSLADVQPPDHTVKLIFIHHSVGENWLADDNGGLGKSLGENNYFVSDTYYGWGPEGIGDRTDIPDWIEWFAGPVSGTYLQALYAENKDDAAGYDYYNRPMGDPGGENEIVFFKSCFPNSNLGGNPDDPAGDGPDMTVAGAKYVYNQILEYFGQHPEKLFIAITPPPELSPEYAPQADAFSRWMATEWLQGYQGTNVGVFDLHAVLSSPDNHHTAHDAGIEYVTGHGNTLSYPTEDPHPSAAGNKKATKEFVPLLNYYYHQWKEAQGTPAVTGEEQVEPDITREVTVEPSPVILEQPADDESSRPAPAAGKQEGNSISEDWTTYDDGNSEISLVKNGDKSRICIKTRVNPGGWTSVETLFDSPRDWSGYSGISFQIQADTPDSPYTIALYAMTSQHDKTRYVQDLTTGQASPGGDTVQVLWTDLVSHEAEGSYNPSQAGGIFFSFGEEINKETEICFSQISLIP